MRDFELVRRIFALVADLGGELSRPERKFLSDLIFGVLCSQSTLLSEIARSICLLKNVKTVWKRLDYNFGLYDLSRPYLRAQTKMLRQVDEN